MKLNTRMNERVLDLLKSGFVKKGFRTHRGKKEITYTKKADIEDIMNKELDLELVKCKRR